MYRLKQFFLIGIFFSICVGCAIRVLKPTEGTSFQIKEFDERVVIEEIPDQEPIVTQLVQDSDAVESIPDKEIKPPEPKSEKNPPKTKKKPPVKKELKKKAKALKHEPDLEGQEGFEGRRPLVDPFIPGEKVVYDVTYMGMTAGHMSLEVLPFVQVNGRKHYHFQGKIWTTKGFSRIYSVEDSISSMMDYETLLPTIYKLKVSESSHLKEARFYIDWAKLTAFYWEKKYTEKEGEQEKKYDWEVLPYSQDVFSSLFYLRVFPWQTVPERAFRVADDKQNQIYRGKVLRKEQITVPAGTFNTIVIQPKIELQGKFKPSGDIFIWLSDDEHKQILKIQAKVTFGSIRAEASQVIR